MYFCFQIKPYLFRLHIISNILLWPTNYYGKYNKWRSHAKTWECVCCSRIKVGWAVYWGVVMKRALQMQKIFVSNKNVYLPIILLNCGNQSRVMCHAFISIYFSTSDMSFYSNCSCQYKQVMKCVHSVTILACLPGFWQMISVNGQRIPQLGIPHAGFPNLWTL
jgi:hypothetical protein